MKPAIFLDRDGTLNRNCPYCKNEDEIVLYQDIFGPLAELSKTHYIIIITNQSGVARGYFTIDDLERMHAKIRREIKAHGGRIDAIYYCIDLPEAASRMRKPNTGMVEKALRDFDILAKTSFVVGDEDADMLLARNLGMRAIRVRNRQGKYMGDFYADDFNEVLEIIRNEEA